MLQAQYAGRIGIQWTDTDACRESFLVLGVATRCMNAFGAGVNMRHEGHRTQEGNKVQTFRREWNRLAERQKCRS